MTVRYKVDGMTCEGCVRSLTRALEAAQADADPKIDLEAGSVVVTNMSEAQVRQAVEDAGFDFAGAI